MEKLITIENGECVPLIFSSDEYERSSSRLCNLLVEHNLDSVIFTSHYNINYYSDFLFCYLSRFYAFIVTHDKATLVSANMNAGQPWRRTYGDNLI